MKLKKKTKENLIYAIIFLAIAGVAVYLFFFWNVDNEPIPTTFQQLRSLIEDDKIEKVTIIGSGNDIFVYRFKQKAKRSRTLQYHLKSSFADTIDKLCIEHKVAVEFKNPKPAIEYVLQAVPLLMFFVLLAFVMKIFKEHKALEKFKKSLVPVEKHLKLDQVAGTNPHAMDTINAIIKYINDHKWFTRLGAKPITGALFEGPPGTGKTMLAKALAGELGSGVEMLSISASELIEKYVGVGAQRLRELFEEAVKLGKCIIFIDEIDAIGKKRSGHNEEQAQTLNQLLTLMDGFRNNHDIFVIAATNLVKDLDPALVRPGRFDRVVTIGHPDCEARARVLQVTVESGDYKIAKDVDFEKLATITHGLSCAELAKLVNEAALKATMNNADEICRKYFDQARDEMLMGQVYPIHLSPEDEKVSAYHEAGHAVLCYAMKDDTAPIYKVTVIPRPGNLGCVVRLQEEDKVIQKRTHMWAELCILQGGRIAEDIHSKELKSISSGAKGDFKRVRQISSLMIFELGMSEKDELRNLSLGRPVGDDSERYDFSCVSEDMKQKLLKEREQLMIDSGKFARETLQEQEEFFKAIVAGLIEKKDLTNEDIEALAEKFYKKAS